jgi:hypothetical protein
MLPHEIFTEAILIITILVRVIGWQARRVSDLSRWERGQCGHQDRWPEGWTHRDQSNEGALRRARERLNLHVSQSGFPRQTYWHCASESQQNRKSEPVVSPVVSHSQGRVS